MNNSEFPSDLTQIVLNGKKSKRSVMLPKLELFRVKNIFKDHEYLVDKSYLSSLPKVVVDIGANVGLFALYMTMTQNIDVMHCFEPTPSSIKLLTHNTAGIDNIHIHPVGLSNFKGEAFLDINPRNSGENKLVENEAGENKKIKVRIESAADAFKQLKLTYIDILKVDTEGCEVQILDSLKPWLGYVGIILVEYHDEADRREIDNILNGYNLFGAKVAMMGCGVLKYINRRILKL